jgi:hypothetical protein
MFLRNPSLQGFEAFSIPIQRRPDEIFGLDSFDAAVADTASSACARSGAPSAGGHRPLMRRFAGDWPSSLSCAGPPSCRAVPHPDRILRGSCFRMIERIGSRWPASLRARLGSDRIGSEIAGEWPSTSNCAGPPRRSRRGFLSRGVRSVYKDRIGRAACEAPVGS